MTQGPKTIRETLEMPIIITGPAGSGKSLYADRFAKYFRKTKIIDDYCDVRDPTENALYLTQKHYSGSIPIEIALTYLNLGKEKIDPVNHPPHYLVHPSGIECITIAEHFNFCLGNALKYIWRSGEKGAQLEDLRKARWYLDREIKRLEEEASP